MKKHIIFDLDQTLVDTSIAEPYRNNRDWSTVYSLIPEFELYPDVQKVFEFILSNGIKTCIVSTAPRTYIKKVVDYFRIPIHHIVGYHDAKPIKPSPAPMLKALELLGADPKETISFGDKVSDIFSSKAAGIESVACSWGTEEELALANCNYDYFIGKPEEMIKCISGERKKSHLCKENANDSMINHQQLIAVQNIEGYGLATNRKVSELIYKRGVAVNNADDLLSILVDCHRSKIIRRTKPSSSAPTIAEVSKAWEKAGEIIKQSEAMGIGIVSIFDTLYPEKLKYTVDEKGKLDPPLLLYYKGDLSIANLPGVAIIGTREPTIDGIKAGEFFGEKFAESGFNIVSGLALGCDSSGHSGALKCVNGKTTAFLAHGLDSIYPVENTRLANEIIENGGLLMSEYPIGVSVNKYNLVSRDRLQAGLADATLVIQTGVTGGTMHAVNATLSARKPLLCVYYSNPATRNSARVMGNVKLLREGKAEPISADESVYRPIISRIKGG